jgi:hypothetical protein
MACALTSGRIVPCRNKAGGLLTAYFCDYGTMGAITESAGLISALAGTPAFYEFNLRGVNSLDSAVASSRENGTTAYTQTLTLQLQYYDRATSEQIKLLAVGRPHIVVVDNDDNYLMIGKTNGAELTTGNFLTGAAMSDHNGFNLTFEAIETGPPAFVTGSVITALANATQINTFPTA